MPKRNIQAKDFNIKTVDNEDYHFIGKASTYGNSDRDGDIFQKGAFSKSVSAKHSVPMLLNHETNTILGKMEVEDSDDCLIAKGIFDLNISKANDIYSLVKMGALDSMSVGFMIKDYEPIDNKRPYRGWLIKEAELLEVSIVTVPANAEATISDVKDFNSQRELFEFIGDTVTKGIDKAWKMKAERENLIKKLERI